MIFKIPHKLIEHILMKVGFFCRPIFTAGVINFYALCFDELWFWKTPRQLNVGVKKPILHHKGASFHPVWISQNENQLGFDIKIIAKIMHMLENELNMCFCLLKYY